MKAKTIPLLDPAPLLSSRAASSPLSFTVELLRPSTTRSRVFASSPLYNSFLCLRLFAPLHSFSCLRLFAPLQLVLVSSPLRPTSLKASPLSISYWPFQSVKHIQHSFLFTFFHKPKKANLLSVLASLSSFLFYSLLMELSNQRLFLH